MLEDVGVGVVGVDSGDSSVRWVQFGKMTGRGIVGV